jgi:two-component system phosphate regulon sensor histidine kinase PhoR
MLELDRKDILGKKLDNCLVMSDNEQKLTSKNLLPHKKLTKDTVVFQKNELRVSSPSGKQLFVNLTSSGIKEGNEIGLGAIITISDVSKERELEEMKIDFVSMAAHELRTPITSARGYLSLIQDECLDKLSPEQKSYIDKAFISSTQLASLVDNLLAVSRIERGAVNLQIVPANWSKIVKDCLNNFLPLAREKKIKLSVKIPEKLLQVLVDEFRISEVLSNLLANALAYTKAGGSVKVEIEVNNKEIVTHVLDTGIGIPAEALPRLFTKFFRVSGALEQGSKGTGLGLYISKAIVEMHRGKIWVESKLGEGSTFSFSIPTVQNRQKINK